MPRPEDKPHPVFEDRPGKGKGDPDHKIQPSKPVKEEETGELPPDPNAPQPNQDLPGPQPRPDQTLPGDLPPA